MTTYDIIKIVKQDIENKTLNGLSCIEKERTFLLERKKKIKRKK